MTAETRRIAAKAIDAAVNGDVVAQLVYEINLFEAVRSHAVSPEAKGRIDAKLKMLRRELHELKAMDKRRREGY